MARKKVSSWKKKQFFTILAPKDFEYRKIGECIAKEPGNVVGRMVDVSLWEMLKDKSKQHMKIIFEIVEVKRGEAHTRFKKFEVNPGYLRSKVKKGASKIDSIIEVTLKDDVRVQVKTLTITYKHISSTKKRDIRAKVLEITESYSNLNVNEFIQQAIAGKIGSNIYKEVKRISPVRRVELEEIKAL
ncbi:MAG: hypothetical protein B6U97_00075 [Candidatus Altiarchaeales archaeon ex4484_96]|nr:MAG: hypothetical protein B6U97_00075 [Candidatus Altiarchaeales archaeon ex4484_96]